MAGVKCKFIDPDGKKPHAVIADFANGRLKDYSKVQFKLYQRENSGKSSVKRKLCAASDRMRYASEALQVGGFGQQYLVGVYDAEMNKLKIQSADIFTMSPDFSDNEEEAEDTRPQTYREKADDLTSAFGSTKRKRLLEARQQNVVQKDAVHLSVGAAVEDAIAEAGGLLSTSEGEQKQEASTVIPKHNREATKPEEVYLLDDIVSRREQEAMLTPAQKLIEADSETRLEWAQSGLYGSFIDLQLRRLPVDDDEKAHRCCLLLYLHYMMIMFDFKAIDLKSKDPAKFPIDMPAIVKKELLFRYTSLVPEGNRPRRFMGKEKKDKLLAHLLVLCLILEDFKLELTPLQKDLKLGPKVVTVMRALGCAISTQKMPESGQEQKTASLPIPLKFPEVRARARKDAR